MRSVTNRNIKSWRTWKDNGDITRTHPLDNRASVILARMGLEQSPSIPHPLASICYLPQQLDNCCGHCCLGKNTSRKAQPLKPLRPSVSETSRAPPTSEATKRTRTSNKCLLSYDHVELVGNELEVSRLAIGLVQACREFDSKPGQSALLYYPRYLSRHTACLFYCCIAAYPAPSS